MRPENLLHKFMEMSSMELGLYGLAAVGIMIVVRLLLGLFLDSGKSSDDDARLANWFDVKRSGLMDGKEGVVVGRYRGKLLTYSAWFVALLAATRSGKGVAVVIPTLLSWFQSCVVLDIKKENFNITSKFRSLFQPVYLFSPFTLETHRWNPLAYIEEAAEEDRVPEVMAVGTSLYPNVVSESGDWNGMARNLFVGLTLYLLETEELPTSFGELLRQASGKGKPLKKHLENIIKERKKSGRPLSEVCVDSLMVYINSAPNTASSIMSTFTAPLTLWRSPVVDAATEKSDFSLRQLRRKRMSIYVNIPVPRLDESKLILNLFFTQLIKHNTDIELGMAPDVKYKCLLLLDEALAAGYMPILHAGSAFIASFGLIMVTIAQSFAQLSAPVSQGGYGREGGEALLENHGLHMQFRPKSQAAAENISKMIGPKTVKSIIRSRRRLGDGSVSDKAEPVMPAHKILRMPDSKQLIFLDDKPPIYCDKVRYYDDKVFVSRLLHVCPELGKMTGTPTPRKIIAKLRGLPTHERLKEVIIDGGLRSEVPVQKMRETKPAEHIVEVEAETEGGYDFTVLPEIPDEPIDDKTANDWAVNFCTNVVGIEMN